MNVTYRPIGHDWQGPRTDAWARKRSPFRASWERTRLQLDRELQHLSAVDVVFQLDMSERDIRLDGMPRSDARPTSPAVILSFKSKHGPLRYQCDAFDRGGYTGATSWQDNVRAIALGLEALRQVERYGITRRGEQYTGWKALPATTMSAEEAQAWLLARGEGGRTYANLNELYRSIAKQLHPDMPTGSREQWEHLQRVKVALGL